MKAHYRPDLGELPDNEEVAYPDASKQVAALRADIAALREALQDCLTYVDMCRKLTGGEGDIAAMNARAALARTERGDK